MADVNCVHYLGEFKKFEISYMWSCFWFVAQLELTSKLESDLRNTEDWVGNGFWILILKKLRPSKWKLGFILGSLVIVRLRFISLNLPSNLLCNSVTMCRLVLLIASWFCCISHRNGSTTIIFVWVLLISFQCLFR